MRILYLKTDIFDKPELWKKAFNMISEERRERIRSYKNEMTARLSLGAGVLLRIVMDRNAVSEDQILRGTHGKPYVLGNKFYFNLSHSGEYVFCVYDNEPIGIDLQKIKDHIPKHTDKILSAEEKEYLEFLNTEESVSVFYQLWSDKESVIKWDGRGLRLPLQRISVVDKGKLISAINFEGEKLHLRRLNILQPDYAVSICTQQESEVEELQEIDKNFLIKY